MNWCTEYLKSPLKRKCNITSISNFMANYYEKEVICALAVVHLICIRDQVWFTCSHYWIFQNWLSPLKSVICTYNSYLAPPCALQVVYFPRDAKSLTAHPREFLLLAGCGLLTSFTSRPLSKHPPMLEPSHLLLTCTLSTLIHKVHLYIYLY